MNWFGGEKSGVKIGHQYVGNFIVMPAIQLSVII